MKWIVVVVALAGCGDPSCKEVVQKAAKTMYGTSANRERTTMMIGTCEQDEWSASMRSCVAGASDEDELGGCFQKHLKPKRDKNNPLEAPDHQGEIEQAVRKLEGFERDMCQCRDKACADHVNETMTRWATETGKRGDPMEKPTPELAKRMSEIMTHYTECMTKVMMAETWYDDAGARPNL